MQSLKKTENRGSLSRHYCVALEAKLNVRDVFLRPDHHGEQRFRKNNARARLVPSTNTPQSIIRLYPNLLLIFPFKYACGVSFLKLDIHT